MRRSVQRSLGTTYGVTRIPPIVNEPPCHYAYGSPEAAALNAELKSVQAESVDIPIVIAGESLRSGNSLEREIPSSHKDVLATYRNADDSIMAKAINAALQAREEWSRTPFYHRAAIVLKAAHLLTTRYRYRHMAATMMGQSKTAWQAEIDCIEEAADFLRFNVKYAEQLYAQQPQSSTNGGVWNTTEYRPLEGFIAAISPFNFSAIGANLAVTPVLLGNVVVWKPSPGAILANYRMLQLLEECGLPPGVINFVPCEPAVMERALHHENLAGVSFTGSTAVFEKICKTVYTRLETYRNFPRVSGETGGKNFHLVHPTADMESVVSCTLRSAFEFQGQKCSACSRLFAPRSKWPAIRDALAQGAQGLRVGPPTDPEAMVGAVINKDAHVRIRGAIATAKDAGCGVVVGGNTPDTRGWFVEPTILEAPHAKVEAMQKEIFGPVLTAYVYDDGEKGAWEKVCDLVNQCRYGLTGSVFSRDREAIAIAQDRLRYASGMLYINDKSTGAVVGQQPFGGARASGTNDKPGGPGYLSRWVSERTIKETMGYERTVTYPHMSSHQVK